MAATYTNRDYWLGVSPTKVWDEDPTTDTTNDWLQLGIEKFDVLKSSETVLPPRAVASRERFDDDAFVTLKGVPFEIAIPSFDIAKEDIDYFLLPFFQSITETGPGPHVNNYVPHDTNPDFESDAGYLLHVIAKHPVSNYSFMSGPCVVRDITINISTDTVGRRMMFAATLLPWQIYHLDDPTVSTHARSAQVWWTLYALKETNSYLQFNSVDLSMYACTINLSNGAMPVGWDSDGRPETFMYKEWTVNGSFTVRRTAGSDGFLAHWVGSAPKTLDLLWQDGAAFDTVGDFRIQIPALLEKPTPDGENEERWEFPFVGVETDSLHSVNIDTVTTAAPTGYFAAP
jgi:hypothetical protein